MFSPPLTGIKKYIVGLVIKLSSDSSAAQEEKVFLSKLNVILVQVRPCTWNLLASLYQELMSSSSLSS